MTKEEYTELVEYRSAMALWKYVPPFLLVIGLMGNILVFVVLSKSSMKLTTTSLYLRFLAVFDTFVLYTGLFRLWILYLIKFDLRSYSPVACKIHTWAVYLTTYTSAWLLVSVTLERCFSVWFPHKVKVICTKRKTYIIIVCIILCMTLLNSHFTYGLGNHIKKVGNMTLILPCSGLYRDYYIFQRNIWPWVDFCIYSIIPSLILIGCNISIIYKVVSSSRQALRNDSLNNIRSRHLLSRRSQASSLTAMLVVTSVTYVICSTPFCIFAIYLHVYKFSQVVDPHNIAVNELIWALVNMLQYTNNCINFVLYCISGQRFRDELWTLFFCGEQRGANSEISNISLNSMRYRKRNRSSETITMSNYTTTVY